MRWLAIIGALVIASGVALAMWEAERVAEVSRSLVDNTFPGERLRDWKDFADHVALVTVADEEPLERAGAPFAAGRRVWLQVDRVLWSAPHAPQLPPVLSTRTFGWADAERRVLVKEEGAARLTLHRSYVIPLVLYDEQKGAPRDWGPLTNTAIMPVFRGRVIASGVWAGEARRRLHERTLDDVRRIVLAEPPHPLAARHRHLRPYARMERMARAGG